MRELENLWTLFRLMPVYTSIFCFCGWFINLPF